MLGRFRICIQLSVINMQPAPHPGPSHLHHTIQIPHSSSVLGSALSLCVFASSGRVRRGISSPRSHSARASRTGDRRPRGESRPKLRSRTHWCPKPGRRGSSWCALPRPSTADHFGWPKREVCSEGVGCNAQTNERTKPQNEEHVENLAGRTTGL